MTQSIFFFDIDGTLISTLTNQIPESTKAVIQSLKKQGHVVCINTGRTMCSIRKDLIDLQFDAYLCGCGTHLIYKKQPLLHHRISEERGQEIIHMMDRCRIEGILEAAEDIYHPRKTSRFPKLEKQRTYIFDNFGVGDQHFIEDGHLLFDKLFVYTDEQSDIQTFRMELSKDMDFIDRGKGRFEIIPKGFSKYFACQYITEKLGIDPQNTYAFGDSTNDLSMFQYANHAIAMGYHARELEPFTEYITKTVEEDGILYALEEYGFL